MPVRPEYPQFSPVPREIASSLLRAAGLDGEVRKMEPPAGPREGVYAVHASDGLRPVFLKVLQRRRLSQQVQVEAIVAQLAQHQAPVNPLLPGYPRFWDDEHVVFAYPFLKARFAEVAEDDLRGLGHGLAVLHRSLQAIGVARQVQAFSEARAVMLEECRQKVARGKIDLGPDPSRLRSALWQAGIAPAEGAKSQAIHGDITYANVLFQADGSLPVFIDFEDVPHTWLPPLFDVAMAMERFCLQASDDDEVARRLAVALISSYAERYGEVPIRARGELAGVLRMANWRALCMLVALALHDEPPAESEWLKFLGLLEESDRREALLNRIEAHFL